MELRNEANSALTSACTDEEPHQHTFSLQVYARGSSA